MAFVAWMAFKRRSLALALIAIGFAAQWIPWARIDRAAFQYHYYTALPFVVLALAYFVAELWHGASRRTWALARVAGRDRDRRAGRCMWLLDRPLCAFVGVESVNPGSQACPAVIPDFVLTAADRGAGDRRRASGCSCVMRGFLGLRRVRGRRDAEPRRTSAALRSLVRTGRRRSGALVAARRCCRRPRSSTLTNIPVEPIALVVAIPLGYLGAPGPRLARRPPVRRRLRRRGRRLVRDPLPEHHRAAAAVGGRGRLPGHPADLPVRVPVPGQHGRPGTSTRRSSRRCSRS